MSNQGDGIDPGAIQSAQVYGMRSNRTGPSTERDLDKATDSRVDKSVTSNSKHDIDTIESKNGTDSFHVSLSPPNSLDMPPKQKPAISYLHPDHKTKKDSFESTDLLTGCANCCFLLCNPRGLNTMRFANSAHEHEKAGQSFRLGKFHKLHLRFTAKYKYHPLQRKKNLIRRFNATESLADHMLKLGGTKFFYHAVCGHSLQSGDLTFEPDLTTLNSLSTIFSAGNYVYQEMKKFNSVEKAAVVRRSFERGFSRKIDVYDLNDWEAFRMELLAGRHMAKSEESSCNDRSVVPIAVSYKAKEVKITRRIYFLRDDGSPTENGNSLAQQEQRLTSDFVDDFRWGQLVRTCMQIAKSKQSNSVRLWIDRLVTMELSAEEKKRMYKLASWWDFGLLPYAVCPVARLYEQNEVEFGTDFWRKIETVLGVAGHGIFVDDYLLRVFDRTIYYGPEIYSRMGSGISMIGGDGVYLRAVTLALATAVLTDGITVRGINEDMRTVNAISGFKAWALRTIGEGAYSSSHAALLRIEDPYVMRCKQFQTIATWESFVSTCDWLTGKSYMDLSYQRAQEWRTDGHWDGVVEWVGMVKNAVTIEERDLIMNLLHSCVQVRTWVATTGHATSMLNFEIDDTRPLGSRQRRLKRSLVVALSRFSNSSDGHVSAVAEATGLWGESVLPSYLRFGRDTNRYQPVVKFMDCQSSNEQNSRFVVRYEHAPIYFCCPSFIWTYTICYFSVFIIGAIIAAIFFNPTALVLVLLVASGLFLCISICCGLGYGIWYVIVYHLTWPWADLSGFGEAVFDNVLMHSLYGSGIKVFDYRELKLVNYRQINWH